MSTSCAEAQSAEPIDWLSTLFWVGATCFSIWLVNAMSHLIFGQSIVDTVIELTMVCLVTVTLCAACGGLAYVFCYQDKILRQSITACSWVVVAIYVLVPHTIATISLRGLKQEYVRTANGPCEVQGNALDYNGQLDRIVLRRDSFLREHHLRLVGEWRVAEHAINTFGVYTLRL